ncbi:MAG: nitrous oxide reductase accessory protein NosL [Phycisphaerae bacterium]
MNTIISRRKMLRLSTAPALAAVLGLAGCARHNTVLLPPKIHYGYDTCAWCGMIISNPHFAAAVAYNRNGTPHDACFDDIGCMLSWQKAHGQTSLLKVWVKNYATQKWMAAQRACFIHSAAIITPMASGIAAGATLEQAKSALPQLTNTGYKIMTYATIRRFEINRNKNGG